ncbi:MAG TPA: hypothetical protein VM261_01230 [Kofleriaceae bacterium]|nr:hypothetical protein [Kofleriaceae bacterium]
MIPYEELSAALERWRVKNGLPGTPPLFAEGSTMKRQSAAASTGAAAPSYSAPAPSYSAPPPVAPPPAPSYSASSYGSGPLYAPPAAPAVPPPPSSETLDEAVDEFAEDDVLDEAQLDNDGPDYAMAFDAPPPPPGRQPATLADDDDDHESTTIGTPGPSGLSREDEDEFNASEKTPV